MIACRAEGDAADGGLVLNLQNRRALRHIPNDGMAFLRGVPHSGGQQLAVVRKGQRRRPTLNAGQTSNRGE